MPSVEERLAPGRSHERAFAETLTMMRDTMSLLRDSVASLERRMDRFEQRVDTRFEALDVRLDGLDDKMSNRLGWVIGLFITSTIAIIATILTRP